jgi:hypothetical protein
MFCVSDKLQFSSRKACDLVEIHPMLKTVQSVIHLARNQYEKG